MAAVCATKLKNVPFSFASVLNPSFEIHGGDVQLFIDGINVNNISTLDDSLLTGYGYNVLDYGKTLPETIIAYGSIGTDNQMIIPLNDGYRFGIGNIYHTDIYRRDLLYGIMDNTTDTNIINYIRSAGGIYELGGASRLLIDSRGLLIIDDEKRLAAFGSIFIESDSDEWNLSVFGYPAIPLSICRELYVAVKGLYSDSDDPYDDDSDDGGGNGSDDGDDNIDIPNLPDLSAVDTGFINLFTPSIPQIKALARFMWSTDFFDNIIKLWTDPMQVILGLSIVPVTVPTAGAAEVTVGNVSTGVSMNKASSQYVSVDCGSIKVNEYYGSYLDYAPYTKISIYLPYCGTHALDCDEVMNETLHVVYHVDILSGACVAFIKVGNKVLYTFTGNCATNIPVTGENFSRMVTGAINATAMLGATALSGGAAAPITAAGLASTAATVMTSKPDVEHSGSVSGSTGLLAIQKPYLIRERPRACVPRYQNKFLGYPSFTYKKLSDLSGYTEVEEIHLEKMTCTEAEAEEIIDLLEKGVIL